MRQHPNSNSINASAITLKKKVTFAYVYKLKCNLKQPNKRLFLHIY